MTIHIHSFLLGPLDNLQYLVANQENKEAIIIDPAWDVEAIIKELESNDLSPKAILLTHTHHDHVSALDGMLDYFGDLPVYVGSKEYQLGMCTIDSPIFLSDGDQLQLANIPIEVIETPGHTSGSLCFLMGNHLLAGDTLFVDGCGRCDFKESDITQMFSSLQKLKQLPDSTQLYPGHHYGSKPLTTIGEQKKTNPYLLIENEAFFLAFRGHLQAQYRSIPFTSSSRAEMEVIYKKFRQS